MFSLAQKAPGVYVEEIASGDRPIAGVSTSTAGFIGYVSDNVTMPPQPGKLDNKGNPVPYLVATAKTAVLITSWNSFKNNFGDIAGQHVKYLAQAIYGFFNNGGSRCWVVRVNQDISDSNIEDFKAAADQLTAIDEIALIAAPGVTLQTAQEYLITQCEQMQSRFAILDGNASSTTTAGITYTDAAPATRSSNYAAMYFPWIKVGDEVVPPSGHIAGVYARVDAQRGVYKAPANEVIRGATDVATRVGKQDQGGLNSQGINVIREFGNNITIWGARTFGPGPAANSEWDTEWRYVNVRRLFIYLRASIDQGTQWVVFEPNSSQLWAQIRRNVSAFLTNVWHAGGLFGQKAEEAFYVRCDETTNPPELRALGQVVAEIGVSVVFPAEFVVFQIQQWTAPSK